MTAILLLTRPEPQSRSFLQMCEAAVGRELPSVISPLMEIKPLGGPPDLDRFKTVIVTSSNAVRCLGDALTGRSVATVGEATAELARGFGADAVCYGESLDDFLSKAPPLEGPVMYCRGVHSRGNLLDALGKRGMNIVEAEIYDQVAIKLSARAQDLLRGDSKLYAPVFSPRTAKLLAEYEISANVTLIAISEHVAEVWGADWNGIIAKSPTAKAMCDAVTEAF